MSKDTVDTAEQRSQAQVSPEMPEEKAQEAVMPEETTASVAMTPASPSPMAVDTEHRPVSRKDMTRRQWLFKEIRRNKIAYLMVGPFMVLFFIFTVLPVILSIGFSFTDLNMLQTPHFKGISNYIRLFTQDEIFLKACKNTLIFAAVTGPVSYIMSLLIAWFINELPPKIRAVVTLIFYAPSISGQVYLIWGTLFSSDSYGWVNAWGIKLGIISSPVLWFQTEKYIMPLCIVVALWTSLGTAFLSFIAGLQGIDRSLFEAGAVDGVKNRWQELCFVERLKLIEHDG